MRRKVALVAAAALAGCYKPGAVPACVVSCDGVGAVCPGSLVCGEDRMCHAAGQPICSAPADAPADVPVVHLDVPVDAGCYGHLGVTVCASASETSAYAVTSAHHIDTGATVDCTSHIMTPAGLACVVEAKTITISAALTASGNDLLILFASHSLTVDMNGQIDVSSHTATGAIGPGALVASCLATSAINGYTASAGRDGGGGAGGSFHTMGGKGGQSADFNGPQTDYGVPMPEPGLSQFRAGCPGGDGGPDSTIQAHGGKGGGAVYLLSGGTLVVDGKLDASGGGGEGVSQSASAAGGAAGGAGGMIVLDAPMVTLAGTVMLALGGGGSGGAGMTGNSSQPAGGEADLTQPSVIPSGSAATGVGGSGGAAGQNGNAAGNTTAGAGGGGAGGGDGYILVFSNMVSYMGTPPVFSPSLQQMAY